MSLNHIELRCKRVSNVFASIEEEFLAWTNTRLKTKSKLARRLSPHSEYVSRMPGNWVPLLVSEFTAAALFCRPGTTKKYLNAFRDDLSGDVLDLVRAFHRSPWYYCLFTVSESIGGYFHRIVDEDTGRETLLYSEALTNLLREGKTLFLCLLWYNGECCQTFGIVHSYISFLSDDIRQFARLTVGRQAADTTVTQAMKRDPIPAYFLDTMGEFPPPYHGRERVVDVAHTIKGTIGTDIIISTLSPLCTIEEREAVTVYSYHDDSDPFLSATVYHDRKRNSLSIRSNMRSAYDRIAATLTAADVSMDSFLRPSWNVSIMMSIAITKFLSISPPGAEYDSIPGEATENDEGLDNLNLAMREISDAYNTGREVSVEEIAEKYDLTTESVDGLSSLQDRLGSQFDIDLDGGFNGYAPPPPVVRRKFSCLLTRSKEVSFSEGEPPDYDRLLLELGDELSRLGYETCSWLRFPKLIEDLYYSEWPNTDPTVLMYTFYLLGEVGGEYRAVSDYAIEILRIFWQVLLPSRDLEHVRGFVSAYASLCLSVFGRTGLVDVAGDTSPVSVELGAFRIKASELFRKSIDLDWS